MSVEDTRSGPIIGAGAGVVQDILTQQALSRQDAEMAANPLPYLEQYGGPTPRPLYEAMIAHGTPRQLVDFIKMQREMSKVQEVQGRVWLNKKYRLPNGPILQAAHMTHYSEEEIDDWVLVESWDFRTLKWPGLAEAVQVYDTLQFLQGGPGANFAAQSDEPEEKALENFGYVADALIGRQTYQEKGGDALILATVINMGASPEVVVERYNEWKRGKAILDGQRQHLLNATRPKRK